MKKILKTLFVIIIIFSLSACKNNSNYIIRNVEWNMSTEQVIKSEEKLTDTGEGYQYDDNTYMYSDAVMYDLPCSIVYKFNDSDKLTSIGFMFDSTKDNFEFLNKYLKENYGESTSDSVDDMSTVYKWEMDDFVLSLVFMDYESDYFSKHLLSVLYDIIPQ